MTVFCGRRWRRKIFFSCTVLIGFMFMWVFMTLLLLVAQEQYMKNGESRGTPPDDYMGRGVQVVVGHYNGNLPSENNKKKNLSAEEVNANNFNPQSGVGENGRAVRLSGEEELKAKDLFQINQFNIMASDRIALNRTLPDARKKACREKAYPDNLPDTSVVIVFHNEAYSTLLRTVTSVINRSPKKLLKEIILVDDFSKREFLKEPLEEYVAQLEVPVIIVRADKRVGLIRARLLGAAQAKGEVLTFLDSHCECTKGWLEPLLARIAEDRTIAVCPIIDVVNDQTFAYNKGIELFRGGFNWNLQFRWYAVPPSEMNRRGKDAASPIRSPTMAGGLFSIERKYFYEIGSYDNQMDIWGGENLEMSFRIWQCGGKVEILPCSHVGHVFRKASPHDFPDKGSSKILNSNLVRVAEVWMDEWKYIFYNTASQAKKIAQSIDASERLALRKKLQCKNFKWYLDNVWPENFMPQEGHFFGRIKNIELDLCLQLTYVMSPGGSGTEKRISVEKCTEKFNRLQIENVRTKGCIVSTPGSPPRKRVHNLNMKKCTLGFDMWQLWIYLDNKIKGDEHQCLTATEVSSVWIVQLKECTETEKDMWDYNAYKQSFVHRVSKLCLDKPLKLGAKDEVQLPALSPCSRDNTGQRWNMLSIDWIPKDNSSL